jgi:hypothetical protein
MTERIRQLLDDAVDQLEPQDTDPVGSILRRERVARRRAAMAGVTVAVLAVGAITAGGLVLNRPDPQIAQPLPAASRSPGRTVDSPPVPRVSGGKVIAGGLEMPVPDGWQALSDSERDKCNSRRGNRTFVMLIPLTEFECPMENVEVWGSGDRTVGRQGHRKRGADGVVRIVDGAPVAFTLPGGEPVWMSLRFDDKLLAPSRISYWNVVVMPWSQTTFHMFTDGPAQRAMMAPMRSNPVGAGVLNLPDTAADAYYTGTKEDGDVDDSAAIAELIEILRAQTDVVENADACANASQQTALITFLPTKTELTRHYSASDPTVFRVVISLGGGCQEAVSSHGGRVRLSDETVTSIKTIFGLGAK